jgi:hypothetical protein
MEKKQETYLIPEKGPEGSLTGRTFVYRPGELSERYNLLKAAAQDDPKEKRNYIDIELKDLKRDQAMWNKQKKGYFDDRGKQYTYSQMIKQNKYVRAKAETITDDINLVNQFIQSKSHNWVTEWEKDYEKEYGEPYAIQDDDLIVEKELKKRRAIAELNRLEEKKVEPIQLEKEPLIATQIPEKTVAEIVKEMSEKRRLNEIEKYDKEFGTRGIAHLMRPL